MHIVAGNGRVHADSDSRLAAQPMKVVDPQQVPFFAETLRGSQGDISRREVACRMRHQMRLLSDTDLGRVDDDVARIAGRGAIPMIFAIHDAPRGNRGSFRHRHCPAD